MKRILLFLAIISLTFIGCEKVDVPKGTPKCIRVKIQDILLDDPQNPATVVNSYMYNGELVYFFPSYCCDLPSELFDEKCVKICEPDGGITGLGDGQCADFFVTRTQEEFVWRDDR